MKQLTQVPANWPYPEDVSIHRGERPMMSLGSETASNPAKTGQGLSIVQRPRSRFGIFISEAALARPDAMSYPDILARRVLMAGAATMAAISLIAWMTGLAREPGLAECRVTPASLAAVSHVNATIRMRGNMACAIPIVDRAAGDLHLKIPPEHGVVTLGSDRVNYRPAPQFRGRDFFMIVIRDRAARFDGTSIARVHVFVK